MIYFSFALYEEAKLYIKKFDLKRNLNINFMQVYENDEIKLFITGVGVLNAIYKLSRILTIYNPKKNDIFLNVGLAGSNFYNKGDVLLVNSICYNNNYLYPDIIGKYDINESELNTVDNVSWNYKLTDMEGYGILYVTKNFFYLNNIFIIKVVSDNFNSDLKNLNIDNFINNTFSFVLDIINKNKICNNDNILDNLFINKYNFTKQMQINLNKKLKYLYLTDINKYNLLEKKYNNYIINEKSDLKKLYNLIMEDLNV